MPGSRTPLKKNIYLGLFFVTLSTLMYEILLTRIFSVTMWYHFAFMAISLAMFGMTVGAVLVYLFPRYFTPRRARYHLALSSLFFSLSIIASFLIHLTIRIPLIRYRYFGEWLLLALTYIVVSIPFLFTGICLCLALTKFPRQVSKLYTADLLGSSLGCLLLISAFEITTDAAATVALVAFLAAIGSLLFTRDVRSKKLKRIVLLSALILALFSLTQTILARRQSPLLKLTWVKGGIERRSRTLYKKWNSFSRIRIWGDPQRLERPFGFGFSPRYPSRQKVRQLHMSIDAEAYTVLTAFDGDLKKLEYLKYDITNFAHYLRPRSRVLIIGAGGGRDVLSALAFGQKSVVAVEMNKDIIAAVNRRFADFTGHLDRNPKVTFVNDEARSYIARRKEKFDIIQGSFTDTWAAVASGAFVLTENSLYTVEAWKTFLEHLTPRGILTFSRWYFRDRPGEIYRLTSLASASLKELGVKNPWDHIVIVKRMLGQTPDKVNGVGTILVSKEPFSDRDLDTIEIIADRLQFDFVVTPGFSVDSTFASIASGKNLEQFTARFPIDISPPTDDSPFFFQMLRLRDIFKPKLWFQGIMTINMRSVFILGVLLILVTVLSLLCIIVPLLLTARKVNFKGTFPLFLFFSSIGFGFMLVEISQMQRLIIFLGHPTYALSVVLFALLLSGGLGSYSTRKVEGSLLLPCATRRLLFLLGVLIIFGLLTPSLVRRFAGSPNAFRIFLAAAILFPLGLFMGMAFPLGMKIASVRSASLTPWLWGINGATSVCASVLAVVLALGFGISASFWTGFSFYLLALAAIFWTGQTKS